MSQTTVATVPAIVPAATATVAPVTPPRPRSLLLEFVLGSTAAGTAALFTNPIEVVKTRMQIQGELVRLGRGERVYTNAFQAFYLIGKREGLVGLQGGLFPAILYQFAMNGCRLGFYEPIKRFYTSNNTQPSNLRNVLAGSTSGVFAAFVGSPFFLVKVRLQVQNSAPPAAVASAASAGASSVGFQHGYKGAVSGLYHIAATEGLRGLWRGATSAMLRVGVGSGVQLSTYDACKAWVQSLTVVEVGAAPAAAGIGTHLAASMVSGLFVTLAMNPFDVISTRMYNQPQAAPGQALMYRNVPDCAMKIARSEGLSGFYKGFVPHFLRLGPHTVLSLVIWEQLKQRF